MHNRMSISKLSKKLEAPRKTLNDWNNRDDWRKTIIDIIQEIGESELDKILTKLDEKKGIKKYTQEEIFQLLISIFPTLNLFSDYNVPSVPLFNSLNYLVSTHKHKQDTYMIFIFDTDSFLKSKKLIDYTNKFFRDAENEGKKIKITVFTNGEISRANVPKNVTFLNVRETLHLDEKAIILLQGGGEKMKQL